MVDERLKCLQSLPGLSRLLPVYSTIEEESESAPHPFVFIQIAREIARSNHVASQIPDLLDMLCCIDVMYKEAIKQAKRALMFSRAKSPPRLPESLDSAVEQFESIRSIYISSLLGYSKLHIHNLWFRTSPAHVLIYLNQYFPPKTMHSPRLFHHDLDDNEKQDLEDAEEDCRLFIAQSYELAEERAKSQGQPLHLVLSNEECRQKFPCPIDLETLTNRTTTYLSCVETLVNLLEHLFP
ncbi:hypothetical protein C8J56DRAFT_910962 [Mycena floridula]|nr:hypothetical protein C8J56DRAFT_910962 [Mycena floridula]